MTFVVTATRFSASDNNRFTGEKNANLQAYNCTLKNVHIVFRSDVRRDFLDFEADVTSRTSDVISQEILALNLCGTCISPIYCITKS